MPYPVQRSALATMDPLIKSIAHEPSMALDDERFRDARNVETFLRSTGDWSYNNRRILPELVRVSDILIARLSEISQRLSVQHAFVQAKLHLAPPTRDLPYARDIFRGLESVFEDDLAISNELDAALPPLDRADLWRRIGLLEAELAMISDAPERHWQEAARYLYLSHSVVRGRNNHFEGRVLAAKGAVEGYRAYHEESSLRQGESRRRHEAAGFLFARALRLLQKTKSLPAVRHALHGVQVAEIASGKLFDHSFKHINIKQSRYSNASRLRGDRAETHLLRVDPPDWEDEGDIRICLALSRNLVAAQEYRTAIVRFEEIADAFDHLDFTLDADQVRLERATVLTYLERAPNKAAAVPALERLSRLRATAFVPATIAQGIADAAEAALAGFSRMHAPEAFARAIRPIFEASGMPECPTAFAVGLT